MTDDTETYSLAELCVCIRRTWFFKTRGIKDNNPDALGSYDISIDVIRGNARELRHCLENNKMPGGIYNYKNKTCLCCPFLQDCRDDLTDAFI